MTQPVEGKKHWIAFYVLCLGVLMIVLDTTIVNLALGAIQADLGFSPEALAWVVNAYMLTFGGFLLLSGRLGDLFGPRRVFFAGLALFTVASLACGLATTPWFLIAARAVQGLGGAIVSAVSLSIIMNLFTEAGDRAKAMGFYGFVASGGGVLGAVASGFITDALGWQWNFLVNVPIGIAVYIACMRLLPAGERQAGVRLDLPGAITVTASLLVAVYAVVNGNAAGWTSIRTLGLLSLAAVLMIVFLITESRTRAPLMPLGLFRIRSVATANVVGVLWAAAMFAWFFMSSLYMQFVLGYSVLEAGLAFLPANVIMAVFSIGLSAKLVMRFGLRIPLGLGLAIAAVGLGLFGFAPVDGNFWLHVLPGMALLGIGAGMAFNPVLLAAMSDVKPTDAGLASGVVNTSFMMGGALGLAVLASVAAARTDVLTDAGHGLAVALHGGYRIAFIIGACFAALAALTGAVFLRGGTLAGDPHMAPTEAPRARPSLEPAAQAHVAEE